MKASEARRLSEANKSEYAKRQAEENAKFNQTYQARETARQTKIRTDVEDLVERCYDYIKSSTKDAKYLAVVPVYFVPDQNEVVDNAINRLKRNGYTAKYDHQTTATGVDEYEDTYTLEVSWKENEDR
jgi:uncharacterized membrane protein YqiK